MILISTLVWRPLCSFEGSGEGRRGLVTGFGGYSEGETPLPIPNRAVKPLSADGTWPARAWESRTPPVFSSEGRPRGRPSWFRRAAARGGVKRSPSRLTAPFGDDALAAERVFEPGHEALGR